MGLFIIIREAVLLTKSLRKLGDFVGEISYVSILVPINCASCVCVQDLLFINFTQKLSSEDLEMSSVVVVKVMPSTDYKLNMSGFFSHMAGR